MAWNRVPSTELRTASTITTKIITNAHSFAGSHTTSRQKRLMGIEIYICCIEMLHGPQHKRGTYAVLHRRQCTQHRAWAAMDNFSVFQRIFVVRHSHLSCSAQNFSAARCDCDCDFDREDFCSGPKSTPLDFHSRSRNVRLNLEIEITWATASTAAFCLLEFRFFCFVFLFSCVWQSLSEDI